MPDNTKAEPMTYEVRRQPNIMLERVKAAHTARDETSSMEDLKSAATAAGVDTSGLISKKALAEAITTATSPAREE